MRQRNLFLLFSFAILIATLGLLFVYVRNEYSAPTSNLEIKDSNFPQLSQKIEEEGIQIEEFDAADHRSYRIHVTLVEPLFLAGNFLKGKFIIKGDKDHVPLYFVVGAVDKGKISFGKKENDKLVYRQTPVKDISALIGNSKNLTIQLSFPKKLNGNDTNDQLSFDTSRQENYNILKMIIESGTANLPSYTEFSIEQIAIDS